MKKIFYPLVCIGLFSCDQEEPGAQKETLETSEVMELTTPMTFADEDYQGDRSTYFHDWNGSYALVYDGKDLMKIAAPLFYTSGGYPIHTPFNDGIKYLHYDPATRLLEVYFSGTSSIQYLPAGF